MITVAHAAQDLSTFCELLVTSAPPSSADEAQAFAVLRGEASNRYRGQLTPVQALSDRADSCRTSAPAEAPIKRSWHGPCDLPGGIMRTAGKRVPEVEGR